MLVLPAQSVAVQVLVKVPSPHSSTEPESTKVISKAESQLSPAVGSSQTKVTSHSIVLLATQAVLGLMGNDDILFEGPLFNLVGKEWSDTLTGYHHLLFNGILVAVILHVCAALFYLVIKRENLIGAMITGIKWWPAPRPVIRMTPAWLAIPALAAAAALVWAAVTYL